MFLDVKSFAEIIRKDIKRGVEKLPHEPKLTIYVTKHSPATDSYMRNKVKVAEQVGIRAEVVDLSNEPFSRIRDVLYNTTNPSILQLPLREDLIDYESDLIELLGGWDADGLSSLSHRIPATAHGIAMYLEHLVNCGRVNTGCKVVIVNRSRLIGKPLVYELLKRDFAVEVLHSRVLPGVKALELKSADVIVTGVGKADFLKINDIKPEAVIIDAGITRKENGITGDCAKSVAEVADVTPVPGGVGQLTTTYLMMNVLEYYL